MTDFSRHRRFFQIQIMLTLLTVFFVFVNISAQTSKNDPEARQRVVQTNQVKTDKKPKPVLQVASVKPNTKSETADNDANAETIIVGQAKANFPRANEKTATMEKKAFDLLNQKRQAKNLPALVWDEKIAGLARLHSANMAKLDFFSHKSLDGLTVDGRANALNINDWTGIGENIAFNEGMPNPMEAAVEQWQNSPNHQKNLMKNWTATGIGIAITPDGKFYMTQVFIAR